MVKRKTATKKKVSKGRKVVQSKKIVVDGIEFQSLLESTMYKLLIQAGITGFKYEGKKYTTLDSFEVKGECYERARRTSTEMKDRRSVSAVRYTPDFIADDESWFIEVKGRPNESFPLRWKLFKLMTLSMKKPPIIFKPMNKLDCEQVVEILKQKGYAKTKN